MAEEKQAPRLVLQKVYVKDLSLEVPNGHEAFQTQWKPEIKLDLNLNRKPINDTTWELDLSLTVNVTNEEKTAFLIEVHQAGIFLVDGMEEEQRRHVLNTVCANMLFPYARESIDTLAVKGGFPALMLAPVNFDAIYQQALAKRQAEQEAEGAPTLN